MTGNFSPVFSPIAAAEYHLRPTSGWVCVLNLRDAEPSPRVIARESIREQPCADHCWLRRQFGNAQARVMSETCDQQLGDDFVLVGYQRVFAIAPINGCPDYGPL